jgi:hypothetical protein
MFPVFWKGVTRLAKPHKKAGSAIQVASALPADQLAGICKEAADQCKIRLDDAQPGRLLFSVCSMRAARSPVPS